MSHARPLMKSLMLGIVSLLVCVVYAPGFVKHLEWPHASPDFFQEYASARNLLEGLPVYASHQITIPRYLGHPMAQGEPVVVNAHPPSSVLLALPLTAFEFAGAFCLWNLLSLNALLLSLWLIKRGLQIPVSFSSSLMGVALLLLCDPLWSQVGHAQLNLVLTLLLTGTWSAERSGQTRLAGALLGIATAIKLFPGFLVVYYAWRQRWSVVTSAFVSLLVVVVLSAAVLGVDTYCDYFTRVLPATTHFQVGWKNASLFGLWSRLFDPDLAQTVNVQRTEAWLDEPRLARVGALICSATLVALLAWVTRPASPRAAGDPGFALAMIAMLLVSPITWPHYLLILLVPIAVVWVRLPPTVAARTSFAIILAGFWMAPQRLWSIFKLNGRAAMPFEALVLLPYQCYALLGLFALGILELRGSGRSAPAGPREQSASALQPFGIETKGT